MATSLKIIPVKFRIRPLELIALFDIPYLTVCYNQRPFSTGNKLQCKFCY